MPPENLTRHLRIHGRVQGVGYRQAMVAQATRLGLRGWVRNRFDGSVEALVAGSADAVERLRAWAARGPGAAQVSAVDDSAADAAATAEAAACDGFNARPSA